MGTHKAVSNRDFSRASINPQGEIYHLQWEIDEKEKELDELRRRLKMLTDQQMRSVLGNRDVDGRRRL